MDKYIKIAVFENATEAQLMESILKEQQLPHRIRSFHDTAYDGLFQVQKGWGELFAPPELETEILSILNDVRSQEF
jgi:hypothetical protein